MIFWPLCHLITENWFQAQRQRNVRPCPSTLTKSPPPLPPQTVSWPCSWSAARRRLNLSADDSNRRRKNWRQRDRPDNSSIPRWDRTLWRAARRWWEIKCLKVITLCVCVCRWRHCRPSWSSPSGVWQNWSVTVGVWPLTSKMPESSPTACRAACTRWTANRGGLCPPVPLGLVVLVWRMMSCGRICLFFIF